MAFRGVGAAFSLRDIRGAFAVFALRLVLGLLAEALGSQA
jgi:hypothetical protein